MADSVAIAALATFAAAHSDAGSDDHELLKIVRSTAAQHANAGIGAPVSSGGGSEEEECAQTPALLAARANHEIGTGQSRGLDDHLAGCLRCTARELKTVRAERAFATVIGGGLALGLSTSSGSSG